MASKNIQNATKSRDIFKIRSYLIADILVDKNLSGIFKEDLEYCLSNGISENELYEAHNGKEISSEATNENYKKLRAGLNSNFSKERVEMLKKIAMKLNPPKTTQENYDQDHFDRVAHRQGNKGLIYVVAGITVLAVCAIVFSISKSTTH